MSARVTQADRDAAADVARIMLGNGDTLADDLRTGALQRHFLLDIMARHREQAISDLVSEEMVERVARAVHEHLSRRDIMQYLANDEDCEGVARAALSALTEPRECIGGAVMDGAIPNG